MRIKCLSTFLDGARRFEADDACTVPDEDAQRFIAQGWAVAEGEQPADPAMARQ